MMLSAETLLGLKMTGRSVFSIIRLYMVSSMHVSANHVWVG